jgi:hypothetical protein
MVGHNCAAQSGVRLRTIAEPLALGGGVSSVCGGGDCIDRCRRTAAHAWIVVDPVARIPGVAAHGAAAPLTVVFDVGNVEESP